MTDKYFIHTDGKDVFVIRESDVPTKAHYPMEMYEGRERYSKDIRDKSVIILDKDNGVAVIVRGLGEFKTGIFYPLPENYHINFREKPTGIISGGLIPQGQIGGRGLTHHTERVATILPVVEGVKPTKDEQKQQWQKMASIQCEAYIRGRAKSQEQKPVEETQSFTIEDMQASFEGGCDAATAHERGFRYGTPMNFTDWVKRHKSS